MGQHVRGEVAFFAESLATCCAGERPVTSVQPHMVSERTGTTHRFVAHTALETFLSSVYSHVGFQSAWLRKRAVTNFTSVGFLSCMHKEMHLQMPRGPEAMVADHALMLRHFGLLGRVGFSVSDVADVINLFFQDIRVPILLARCAGCHFRSW